MLTGNNSTLFEYSLLAEALERTSRCALHVRGDSMHPTIRDGEVVIVESVHRRPPTAGDIVVLPGDDFLYVHRLVGIAWEAGKPVALTAGDGNRGLDGRVDLEQIIGRVVEVRAQQGDWSPDERPVQRTVRGFIGRHPKARRAIGEMKDRLLPYRKVGRTGA